ncbi:endonuclease [Deltaproteobacteria bacterium]|nr:endonuclease [Deltaproteobacteria bacterium]
MIHSNNETPANSPLFLLLSSYAYSRNTQITSFSKSKKLLLKVYKDNPVTLYCGCSFKGKKPNLSSCGYIPKKDNKRANRIEWEHVVPAHAFGQSFSEWRNGHPKCVSKKGKKFKGRKCAQKINQEYRRMQADMFNLYPAIGEVNGRRSNYSMAIIEGEKREFGKCDVEIKRRKVETREEIRGEIARTYMYMDSVYPDRGIISKKNRKLFDAWNKSYPVEKWECERAKRIEKIQENRNEIVWEQC